jgi:hypothetical protein
MAWVTEWIGPARVVFWLPEGSGTEPKMLLARLPSPWELDAQDMEDPYTLLLNAPDIRHGASARAFNTREEAVAFIEWVLERFSGAREDGVTAATAQDDKRQRVHGTIAVAEVVTFLMAPFELEAQQ